MTNLMIALDLPEKWQRLPYELMRVLRNAGCTHYKIHLPFPAISLADTIRHVRKSVLPGKVATVMFDNKEHDIGQTVVNAIVHQLQMGVDLSTVHASGGGAMFAALKKRGLISKVVAVTVLTSMPPEDVIEVFGEPRELAAPRLARIAARHGVNKFVCAVSDIAIIREAIKDFCAEPEFLTPGIRPRWFTAETDQIETATPEEAVRADAHTTIIGRPAIDNDEKAPDEAVTLIAEEIESAQKAQKAAQR